MRRIALAVTDWRAAGRSHAGLLVRVLLVAIVAGILLERLLYYKEQVERSIMETTIVNIRSGMRWHMADLMTRQRSAEVGAMLEQNPVRWLQQPPVGYVGVLETVPAGGIGGGSWYFDGRRRELVYVPRMTRFFAGPEGRREVRFKVRAVATDQAGGDRQVGNVAVVDIVPVQPYRWF